MLGFGYARAVLATGKCDVRGNKRRGDPHLCIETRRHSDLLGRRVGREVLATRPRAHAYTDSYSHSHADAHAHEYPYADSYAYEYPYADSYAHEYPYADSYAYAYEHRYANSDPRDIPRDCRSGRSSLMRTQA